MKLNEVMTELKKLGTEQTRKTFARHGAPVDKLYGVRIGDMKPIIRKIKGNQQLALELYDTGISDAMYLAGLVADGSLMNKRQLDKWAKDASWFMIAETTVPSVACESPHAPELADKWIKSRDPKISACGWATWSGIVATREDEELDLKRIRELLVDVEKNIHSRPDRVRYAMNSFVISVAASVKPLYDTAVAVAKKIGKVEVDMGDTSCKVPLATEYIAKIAKMGNIGRKRKTMKC